MRMWIATSLLWMVICTSTCEGASKLIEGDILTDVSETSFDSGDQHVEAAFRQGHPLLWTNKRYDKFVIPYTFLSDVTDTVKKTILYSIAYLERGSNLKFDYIAEPIIGSIAFRLSNRCVSFLGNMGPKNEVNYIEIEPWLCNQTGAILHEILHALGFGHEHERADAFASYSPKIPIRVVNLDASTDIASPYDIYSVMHYQISVIGQAFDPIHNQQAEIARYFLTACDWAVLNTVYPGYRKPPHCQPGVYTEYFEPDEALIEKLGQYYATYYCTAFTPEFHLTHCRLKNGRKYPDLSFIPNSADNQEREALRRSSRRRRTVVVNRPPASNADFSVAPPNNSFRDSARRSNYRESQREKTYVQDESNSNSNSDSNMMSSRRSDQGEPSASNPGEGPTGEDTRTGKRSDRGSQETETDADVSPSPNSTDPSGSRSISLESIKQECKRLDSRVENLSKADCEKLCVNCSLHKHKSQMRLCFQILRATCSRAASEPVKASSVAPLPSRLLVLLPLLALFIS